MDDDSIAQILAKEARESSQKYSAEGLGAFLPRRPAGNAPKPNTRFLRHLIKETDSHNIALKRKEEKEARERMRQLRDQPTAESTSMSHPSKRHDRHNSTRDSRHHRREREDRHDSHRRRHRSRSSSTERDRSRKYRRRDEDYGRLKDGHREGKSEDRRDSHRRRHRSRSSSIDMDRSHRHHRSDDDHGRLKGGHRHEASRTERRQRERSNSRSRSRSPRKDRKSGQSHSERRSRRESPSSARDSASWKGRIDGRSRRRDDSPRDSRRPRGRIVSHREHDEARLSAAARDEHSHDESDPLEDLVGPLPPRARDEDTPPLRSRGRGAYKHTASTIDAHFAPDYDPTLDVHPDDDNQSADQRATRRPVTGLMTEEDDWDMALEALRDRAIWKQKGEERLRAAGMNEATIDRWKSNAAFAGMDGEGKAEDVRWSKKGEGREWDRGKVMDDEGHIDVQAAWR